MKHINPEVKEIERTNMQKGFRWTIARKVGGIVCVLLLIILALLIHSIIELEDIGSELKQISVVDVPLVEYANEIEIGQLEQRILMDEMIRKQLANNENIDNEIKLIHQWNIKINRYFELAIITAEKGLQTSSQEQFIPIIERLTLLNETHHRIKLLLGQLIKSPNSKSTLDAIIAYDEEFDRHAIELIKTIERLAQRNANTALEHEQQFAQITYMLGSIGILIGSLLAALVVFGIKSSINKLSKNISTVSSAIASNKEIPIESIESDSSSDELGELSDNFLNMVEQVSTDIDKREKASKQLIDIATKDHLTQSFNRLKWDEVRESEIAESIKNNTHLSIIFFDIDHFKRINDTYGHDVGDETLINVVLVAQENLRQLDTLYRTGGEEFAVLLPNSTIDDAQKLAERLRQAMFAHEFNQVGTVTISLGVTEFKSEFDSSEDFTKRADTALYKSKSSGRNCVSRVM